MQPGSRRSCVAGSLLLGVLASAAPAAAQTIYTGPPGGSLAPLGQEFSAEHRTSIGQSFTVGQNLTNLQEFGFHVRNRAGFETLQYRAFIAAWNPIAGMTTGPILWQSDPVSGTASFTTTPITFAVSGLALLPEQVYIAMLSAVELYPPPGTWAIGGVESTGGDTYAGGSGYLLFSPGHSVAELTSEVWMDRAQDFAFHATLSGTSTTVPEPLSLTLFGTGLVGLGVLRRRLARR